MVGGIIAANLFGLRMFQVTQTKLNVTTWSRQTVGQITAEIHACNAVWVGNITTNSVFEGLLDGETQQGTALLIYPTTDTNSYIDLFCQSVGRDIQANRDHAQRHQHRHPGRFGHQHHDISPRRTFRGMC